MAAKGTVAPASGVGAASTGATGTGGVGAVTREEPPPCPRLGAVDVLNPSCRITASRSAFWTGFARYAANKLFGSVGSDPLYALTAMIGVFAFLLFVVLIYRVAPSPSTAQVINQQESAGNAKQKRTYRHVEVHEDAIELCEQWSERCNDEPSCSAH